MEPPCRERGSLVAAIEHLSDLVDALGPRTA